jgi:hypothetical protein
MTAEVSSLDDLLRSCTVRIDVLQSHGTGFFVGPGRILTCAHVVEAAHDQNAPIQIRYQGMQGAATIRRYRAKPYPDLALLRILWTDHPCVYLRDETELYDDLYTFGYTDEVPGGGSATFEFEGPDHEPYLLRLKEGQSRPGLSGAPLLNWRTGAVCGVVKRTRHRDSDLGARAIPMTTVLAQMSHLEALQRAFHGKDNTWHARAAVDRKRQAENARLDLLDLGTAERLYRDRVVRAHSHFTFGGFDRNDLTLDGVPLEQIYIRLSLTRDVIKREVEERESAEMRQTERERFITATEPIDLADALKSPVLLVGEPGAGKSTLMRWLAVTFAQGSQRQVDRLGPSAHVDRLPLLIELGHLPARYLGGDGTEKLNWFTILLSTLPISKRFTAHHLH